jgi:Janus/Ocnus family (Ocnus)
LHLSIVHNETAFRRERWWGMKLIYRDYSRIYYRETGAALPDTMAGKFVQIRNDSAEEYLVFSPKELSRYHADIVRRFCAERGIPGVYNNAHKSFDIHDTEWAVIGGGKFERDRVKKQLRLYDDSTAYGKFNRERLKEKILSLSAFSGYDVRVE